MPKKSLHALITGLPLSFLLMTEAYGFDSGQAIQLSATSAVSRDLLLAQNIPNGNAVAPGGIAAKQLAADGTALDKFMYVAIESSSVENVRDLINSGINLAQDYGYGCPNTPDLSGNYPAEEKFFNIASPDALRAASDMVPGHCSTQHLQHAYRIANKTFKEGRGPSEGRGFAQTHLPPEAMVSLRYRDNNAFRATVVGNVKAEQDRMNAAFEVLALIESNMPPADKTFIPAYIVSNDTSLDPFLVHWLISKYYQALPEIRRARSMREPKHVAWDAYKAKKLPLMEKDTHGDHLRYEVAVFDPKTIPGGDDSSTIKGFVTKVLQSSKFAEGGYQQANSGYFCGEPRNADDALAKQYLSHFVDTYTEAGLASRPFSRFFTELSALPFDQHSNKHAEMAQVAVKYYGYHSLIADLLTKPDVIDALNNKVSLPGGSIPPLNLIVRRSPDPALVRALLNAGVNPGLKAADGKTAADDVIGTTPESLWRAQPFVKASMNDPGCPPGR